MSRPVQDPTARRTAGSVTTVRNGSKPSRMMRIQNPTVTIIDVERRREVGAIEVGVSPNGMLVDGDRNRLWVANAGSDSVSVIDLGRRDVIGEVPVARGPFSLTQSPDGAAVVAVGFREAAVTIVDAASLAPGATVPVGHPGLSEPHPEWGLGDSVYATFSDRRTVWVSNFRTRKLAAVDLGSAVVTDELAFPEGEYPISLDCLDGRYGWVHGLNLLKIVDFTSRRSSPIWWSPCARPSARSRCPSTPGRGGSRTPNSSCGWVSPRTAQFSSCPWKSRAGRRPGPDRCLTTGPSRGAGWTSTTSPPVSGSQPSRRDSSLWLV